MHRMFFVSLYAAGGVFIGMSLMPATAQPMMGGPHGGPYRPAEPYAESGGANAALRGNAERGQRIAASCAACHGADGNSTDSQYPKLAGQTFNYLYAQILAFKSGARESAIMAPLVANLSPADAADVARYYSEQPIKPDRITNRTLARAGERIFSQRGASGSPSCAMCHSGNGARMPMMRMMGVNPADIPNLNGQHAAYILDQLNRYASGARPDGVMNSIAAALGQRERQAAAEYLAGLH